MNKNKFKSLFINIAAIFSLAIFFISDRLLKNIAFKLEENINLVKDFFIFSFTKNYYISFSLPLSGTILNILISLLILILLSYLIFLIINEKEKKTEIILLLFIFFGALSNAIDRINFGFVIDYLEINQLSSFNLADVMITVSSFIIILKNLDYNKNKLAKTIFKKS